MTTNHAVEARLRGAVWGHLVGDAVGVPYEFGPSRPAAGVRFGHQGAHRQPPGTWSDDGALMLALLDSLLDVGFDPADQGTRALAWYREAAYTPGRDGYFDIGNATRSALLALEAGTPALDAGPKGEQSGGNGSLMRILPLALVDRKATDAQLIERAMQASRVTHGHARPQIACALYTLIAVRLIRGTGGRSAALQDARDALRSHLVATGDEPSIEALDHLEAYTERGGRGRVWDSFWSAWDAFAGASDYRDTIQRAVAYGNDTDTTAAIAGGLAGIRWGIDGIPRAWLAGMRGADIVDPMLERLIASMYVGRGSKNPIRVDEVPLRRVPGLADVPGRLGMTFLPGKNGVAGRAGVHRRDMGQDALTLLGLHVECARPAGRGPRAGQCEGDRRQGRTRRVRDRDHPVPDRRRQRPDRPSRRRGAAGRHRDPTPRRIVRGGGLYGRPRSNRDDRLVPARSERPLRRCGDRARPRNAPRRRRDHGPGALRQGVGRVTTVALIPCHASPHDAADGHTQRGGPQATEFVHITTDRKRTERAPRSQHGRWSGGALGDAAAGASSSRGRILVWLPVVVARPAFEPEVLPKCCRVTPFAPVRSRATASAATGRLRP